VILPDVFDRVIARRKHCIKQQHDGALMRGVFKAILLNVGPLGLPVEREVGPFSGLRYHADPSKGAEVNDFRPFLKPR
jgi:hypothetical protein